MKHPNEEMAWMPELDNITYVDTDTWLMFPDIIPEEDSSIYNKLAKEQVAVMVKLMKMISESVVSGYLNLKINDMNTKDAEAISTV